MIHGPATLPQEHVVSTAPSVITTPCPSDTAPVIGQDDGKRVADLDDEVGGFPTPGRFRHAAPPIVSHDGEIPWQ